MSQITKTFSENSKWILIAGLIFAGLNGILIALEIFYLPLIPVALAIIILALFSLDKLVYLIVFLTPLSVNLVDIGEGVGMAFPTDPLLFGVLLVLFLKLILERKFDSRVTDHPITLAIMVNVIWLIITSCTSEIPLVSFKFVLSRMWYLAAFYFVSTQIFRDPSKIKVYLWLYIISLSAVVVYTITRHAMYGFEEQPAHWVMEPFFNDHTSYGAILAMFYPILIGFGFSSIYSRTTKIGIWALIGLFSIALLLSYTRAAWVSLIAAFGVFMILRLKIKFATVALLGCGIVVAFFMLQETIVQKLEKNRQDSSAELGEHVQSISNISTDASNLERLNRWASALRLFEERPFVGWGPGTYAFVYAPFQHSQDKTIISTNAGDKGNAHSEYIGPLAESGLFGSISFILIVICICYYSVILYSKLPPGESRTLLTCMFLGLITYFTHGLLNNFLDADKASAPFWGFTAAIVALDVYQRSKKEITPKI